MATTFLEPGGDATFDFSLWGSKNASPAIVSDFVHGAHQRSIRFPTSGFHNVSSPKVIADTGCRISGYFYFVALPSATMAIQTLDKTAPGTLVALKVTSAGILQLWSTTAQLGSNGPTLLVGRWYRISWAYTITSTTVNRFEIFVDGVSAISVTNGTISQTGADSVITGNSNDALLDFRLSDVYFDDSASLTDPGDIWVTAKRPNANGTTNGFTTQIGAGGSGYGSGHSPQVNERALNTANGWSMVGTGSAVTEEYTIESRAQGDIDLTGARIIDFMGWVYASSALAETASIIVAGVSSNISLTSANTMFTKAAGSTTYPAGGTDIGIITATTATTVRLYEAGILVAYIGGFFPFGLPANPLVRM